MMRWDASSAKLSMQSCSDGLTCRNSAWCPLGVGPVHQGGGSKGGNKLDGASRTRDRHKRCLNYYCLWSGEPTYSRTRGRCERSSIERIEGLWALICGGAEVFHRSIVPPFHRSTAGPRRGRESEACRLLLSVRHASLYTISTGSLITRESVALHRVD